jgi:hypothetical protein
VNRESESLLVEYLDGDPTDDALRRFDELLAGSSELRRRFREEVRLHVLTREWAAEQLAAAEEARPARGRPGGRTPGRTGRARRARGGLRSSPALTAAAAAAAVLVVASASVLLLRDGDDTHVQTPEAPHVDAAAARESLARELAWIASAAGDRKGGGPRGGSSQRIDGGRGALIGGPGKAFPPEAPPRLPGGYVLASRRSLSERHVMLTYRRGRATLVVFLASSRGGDLPLTEVRIGKRTLQAARSEGVIVAVEGSPPAGLGGDDFVRWFTRVRGKRTPPRSR